MLNTSYSFSCVQRAGCSSRQRQQGVVLMVALIILTALMIGGVALMRSVDTTGLISGNLAFQQSATRSGESGTEDAVRSVIETSTEFALQNDDSTKGYSAKIPDPDTTLADWQSLWITTIDPAPKTIPVMTKSCGHGGGRACTLPTDTAGNTVSYTIQRLCLTAGSYGTSATGCSVGSQAAELDGQPLDPDAPNYSALTQYLYRITTRTVGPRNTVSFIQTIVAR
jgi:type IV pilus assembly protein PilX